MGIPQIDPTGYDIIMWMEQDEVYFAEVINGAVNQVLEQMLEQTLASFPDDTIIGIVMPDGALARIGKNRLQ